MRQKVIVDRVLPVQFTDEEILSFKNALAFHVAELLKVEEVKKDENKIHNLNIKDCKDSIADLSEKIESGFENRSVPCRVKFDHTREEVFIIRTDTDEVV